MNYVFFHLISYCFSFLVFTMILYLNKPLSMEMEILSLGETSLCLSLMISFNSLVFIFTVSSIFASVFHYSMSYMSSDPSMKRFMMILFSFVVSMMVLICSGNFFTSLLGWDGLGITSLLLIMHYCSKSSLKASMYTFLMNRLGDCFFLYVIFNLYCSYPSLNIFYHTISNTGPTAIVIFLVLLAITKSAQIPFSSWLTKAMEAPTPVSSLVHSSTLVTAGIFMLYSYQDLWKTSQLMNYFLMVLSISTLFIASICGVVEMDLKKIIAYSTLSQLGFIFFLFSMNIFEAGFFYLIMHAFFKALMFMSSGYIIHHSHGWQDIRKMSLNQICSPTMVKIFYTSSMSLCGLPFLAGFYSKDVVFDKALSTNCPLLCLGFMMMAFMLTVLYVLRTCWYLTCSITPVSSMNDQDSVMVKSSLILFIMSCVMGSSMLWLYNPNNLAVDSPKLSLSIYLFMVGTLFWVWPMMKSDFFLKTMFYLYIVNSIIASRLIKLIQAQLWYLDLLGLVGKFLKVLPNVKSGKEFNIWLKIHNWSLKDFLFISFTLMFFSLIMF